MLGWLFLFLFIIFTFNSNLHFIFQYRVWSKELDEGKVPEGVLKLIEDEKVKKNEQE